MTIVHQGNDHSKAFALTARLKKSNSYRGHNDTIHVSSERHDSVGISFQRTVRVPDNNQENFLPPSLGTFPLYSVANFEQKLESYVGVKGGIFFPMYQREAMWINFQSTSKPFVIKVFTGGINVVSGETMTDSPAATTRRLNRLSKDQSIQDYVVTPSQRWIDGIANEEGLVRQFVAMPLGSGYSVEAQITGEEVHGGLQFLVIPCSKFFGMKELQCKNQLEGNKMTLQIIRFGGENLALHNLTSTNTVKDVKSTISEIEGIPNHEKYYFIYAGKQMDEAQTLGDFNLTQDASLHLVRRKFGQGVDQENGVRASSLYDPERHGPMKARVDCVKQSEGERLHILIKLLTGKSIEVGNVTPTNTVLDLKETITDAEGIPVDQQRMIYNGKQLDDDYILGNYALEDYSIIHMILRLRGGGDARPMWRLGIAPGGLIKQTIRKDEHPASTWDASRAICFNVHILNSELFSQVTGFAPPETPISAKTYADKGLPFFDMYEENSGIKGDNFKDIKSVKAMDKEKAGEENAKVEKAGKGGKRKREVQDDEPAENPVIMLDPDGARIGFKPVSVMIDELKAMNDLTLENDDDDDKEEEEEEEEEEKTTLENDDIE